MLESLFNKVTGLSACNFIKKRFQHLCFPVNISKFFKNDFFYKTPAVAASDDQGKISTDYVLMVDEMYPQKAAQYQNGEYLGMSDDGDLFKGILVFMIVGLKESVPYVIKPIPEVQYSGQLLATKTAECINSLGASGLNARYVKNNNHSANVLLNAYTRIFGVIQICVYNILGMVVTTHTHFMTSTPLQKLDT